MDLYVNAEYLAEYLKVTFGIEGPIVEELGGKLEIRAFDIEYGGETIARSVGGGSIAPCRADGTLELDRLG
ncbi:hypothetical protein [Celeribacter indicus]|uniref:Uncharacterized protein n=1 Tax=Celeribacter indicus TaxID=1208324 RepID=A0A0B5DZ79_9RHOB|nr:hypothetical protein [Celeribacter indicus]AJE48299.1 hypothetical protein P73_3584 [Celeribacter indicus]SDW72128.1 hypothetical protein SAMN05443573_106129 [Celeribacter indicus]